MQQGVDEWTPKDDPHAQVPTARIFSAVRLIKRDLGSTMLTQNLCREMHSKLSLFRASALRQQKRSCGVSLKSMDQSRGYGLCMMLQVWSCLLLHMASLHYQFRLRAVFTSSVHTLSCLSCLCQQRKQMSLVCSALLGPGLYIDAHKMLWSIGDFLVCLYCHLE